MGGRSTALVVILVFAMLFSLIYISNLNIIAVGNENSTNELQSSGRVYADITRMIKPENICSTFDAAILEEYPPILRGLEDADDSAEDDISIGSHYGNYYTGVGLYLDMTDMVSLLRKYEGFNETAGKYTTPNNLFTYHQQYFNCGFAYQEKYYNIGLTFETLEQVHRASGHVPVNITKTLAAEKGRVQSPNGTTFAPFNNTLVFINELASPLTIQVNSEYAIVSESIVLPPGGMGDLHLAADWSGTNDTNYHYSVLEYPWIQGDFSVSTRYTSECLDKEIAKSLYAQSDLEVKFPSYVPEGFHLACVAENTDWHLIQIYVNQTAIDYYNSTDFSYPPYPVGISGFTPEEESKGIVDVHVMKFYSEDPRQMLKEKYQSLLASPGIATNPELFEVAGRSYLTFDEGRLSTVEVATDHELYRLTGSLPMDAMLRIAESLF